MSAVLIPAEGHLRYIEIAGEKSPVRVLQRYEWSSVLSDFGWFDIFVERGE